jgi:hypothetical protein
MRFCTNCGNPVGGSPRYCAGCAAHVDPAPVSSMAGGPLPQGGLPVLPLAPARSAIWPTPPAAPEPDPWTPRHLRMPAAPAAGPWPPAPGPPADPWSAAPAPAGHPQAGGPAGAVTPASDPPRTAPAFLRRKTPPGHRVTSLAMVTTLALLTTAGVAAWQVARIGSGHAPAAASQHPAVGKPASRAGSAGDGGSVSGTGHARPSGSARPARSARPSPSSRPSSVPSATVRGVVGNGVVAVSPAVLGTPRLQPVVAFLTTYFEAINGRDFPQYASLFIPSIRATMRQFGAGYATTFDSGATLTGLAATGPQGVAATVTFTSHQSPAASPDHAACDQWDITLFLRHDAGAYLIGHSRPGFPQLLLPCS